MVLFPPGAGKSTFGSNYYKMLYNVKRDYFETSEEELTFTKGIWMISDEERRKIPQYIYKDILDVEGFKVDESKSWKYVMIIAFLSTDLIILNRNTRSDDVKTILNIIGNGLKKMNEMNLPRVLKVIYIQTVKKKNKPIEDLLKMFNYDQNIFKNIKFKYIYLPDISNELGTIQDLLKYPNYKDNFENIIKLLNNKNNYNSVASLIGYIDNFNNAINGYGLFKSQKIVEDIIIDFNGVYIRYENQLKNELIGKIPDLKLDNINDTFEEFIKKQKNLNFTFEIKNEDFTFYGGSQFYDDIYENLKKNKSFKVDPKDIFHDFYNTEKLKLETKNNKQKEQIVNLFVKKKNEIFVYFTELKFLQIIDENMDLKLNIKTDFKELTDYKLKLENDLKIFFEEKIREKKKEWDNIIQSSKWKVPVQEKGKNICKNGHHLKDDVVCNECQEQLFWVDFNEKYAICKGCNKIRKMTGDFTCGKCGAEAVGPIEWVI